MYQNNLKNYFRLCILRKNNAFYRTLHLTQCASDVTITTDDYLCIRNLMNQKELVGIQLKKARKQMSLSQEDLAKKIGISRMMISRYEVGSSDIPLEKLQRIAELLQKPVSFFFGETTTEDSSQVWKEAQKYLELFKDKVGGELDLSPKDMLAFSLGEGADIEGAVSEAKTMMKNWYLAHNLQSSTNKTFEEWWENTKHK